MQNQGYVSRLEHQVLRPRLHNVKDFYYLHQGTPQMIQTQSSTQEEAQSQDTKPTISTQKMGTKPTPLHKREAQS